LVTWHAFRQPHREERDYTDFGPFRFDADEYVAALERLAIDLQLDDDGHAPLNS
jgi:hypothetical protein